ncbi:MAG: hypothetical protein V4637_08465 [Pseudomonadota bacterium]
MRPYLGDEQAESLLTREAREALPLARQLLLYLDPFFFFKDATVGSAWSQHHARAYNTARRWILLTYARRWLLIASASFFGITAAEAMAAHSPLFIIPAAGFGIGCAVSVTIAAWTSAAYLMLAAQPAGR